MPSTFYRTEFDGVTVLESRDDTHAWRMFHEWYAVPISFNSGARMLYRHCTLEACPMHVNVIEPGEIHQTVRVPTPMNFSVAFFPARLFENIARELGYRGVPHFRPRGEHGNPVLCRSVLNFIDVAKSGRVDTENAMADVIGTLLEDLAEQTLPSRVAATRRAFDAVVEAGRMGGPCPTIRELTVLERISERQLHRSFKRNHGVSPVELFQLVRVARAMKRICGSRSLAEVATECGFADQSHMNRLFRRIVGRSAGRYATEVSV